jgi:hypothetical protein
MKKVLLGCLLGLAVSISLSVQSQTRKTTDSNPDSWKTFTSETGRFSVLLPDLPTEAIVNEPGAYTTHRFTVDSLKSTFIIGWSDYDPSFTFNPALELELNRENFIKGIRGTLINNKSLIIDGYESIEFTAETANKVYRSRVFIVGRRPYLITALTTRGLDDTADVKRFFDSFKVRLQ